MQYEKLDLKYKSELDLVCQSWFSFNYKLTDGVYRYGQLLYKGALKWNAVSETATCKWIFKRERWFSRAVTITDESGQELGKTTREWFSCTSLLTLNSGFQAKFYRPNIFSRKYIWESEGYGKIMHFKGALFGLTDKVYLEQSMTRVALVPLLIFLGVHLMVLEKRNQAAHS